MLFFKDVRTRYHHSILHYTGPEAKVLGIPQSKLDPFLHMAADSRSQCQLR